MFKKTVFTLLTTLLCFAHTYAEEESIKTDDLDLGRLSEAFGHFIGKNLNPPGLKFDVDRVVKGIRDGAEGNPAPMSDTEYEQEMAKLQIVAFQQVSENNLKEANAYLEENASKPDVHKIEDGKIQYAIIHEGSGAVIEEHFSPSINYKGSYIDGTVFGSSEEQGAPTTISLDQTIPGFNKGLVGMKEGEKRKLFIHPDLGYGTSGHLAPNSLLIFEIEVVKANDTGDEEQEPLKLEESEEE